MTVPCRKQELDKQEISSGIVYDPSALMWSDQRQVMPPSQILYDYMHTYLCNGVASWEVALFLDKVYSCTEITRESLLQSVLSSAWKGTQSSGKTEGYLANLFHQRMFSESLYKGEANQTAAIVPLLRFYLETHLLRSLPTSCINSFRALSDIVTKVKEIQYALKIEKKDIDEFAALQRKHHNFFGESYGGVYKPKHHHRFHIPAQWEKVGVALSCEGLEAKHSLYKSGVGDRLKQQVQDSNRFSAAALCRLLKRTATILQKDGLPFWELMPPIKVASRDDRIAFTSMDLKTSKSPLFQAAVA
jgi:hypothetical protein